MSSNDNFEEEIREIRDLLRRYIDDSVERHEQRRAENIQILVSLGILGGFITLYVQGIVAESPLQPFFWIIALVSGAFLVLKTLISPLAIGSDSIYLSKFDFKWSLLLYVFFLSLSILIGLVLVLPLENLTVPEFVESDFQLISGIVAMIVSFVATYYYRKSVVQASREREQTQYRLQEILSNINEKDVIDLFTDHPEILSEILDYDVEKINAQPVFKSLVPDFVVETEDGQEIIVEISSPNRYKKWEKIEQLQRYLSEFAHSHSGDEEILGYLIETSNEELRVLKINDRGIVEEHHHDIKELVDSHTNIQFERIFDL